MFENPHILELLKIIEKEWDKRFPLSFITNGRKLADTPDIFEAVQDMQKKYGKKKIMIQVTDDPRFYPQPLSEKQKYRLKKLDAVIEGVPGNLVEYDRSEMCKCKAACETGSGFHPRNSQYAVSCRKSLYSIHISGRRDQAWGICFVSVRGIHI